MAKPTRKLGVQPRAAREERREVFSSMSASRRPSAASSMQAACTMRSTAGSRPIAGPDHVVFARAIAEDRIVVTENAEDAGASIRAAAPRRVE
jgi:hypothetical protein